MEKQEKQSANEMKLHKRFEFWDEAVTFTRYLMIALLGAAFYEFSVDGVLYAFLLSVVLNGYCYYSMKATFDNIVKDRIDYNYGSK